MPPYTTILGKRKAMGIDGGYAKKSRLSLYFNRRLGRRYRKGYNRSGGYYGRYRRVRYGDTSGVEMKFFDNNGSNLSIAESGTVVVPSLNLLTAGNGESNINGRKMVVKKINCRMTARKVGDSGSSTQVEGPAYIRIILILDTQCNGAAATIANVFDTPTRAILAFKNMEYNRRFKILRDWVVPINNQSSYTGTANTFANPDARVYFADNLNVNIPINYSDNPSGIISNVRSNNLVLMGFASADGYSLDLNIRLRFIDS